MAAHESACVLSQAAVDVKSNEFTVVPTLVARRDVTGTVTTLDALLTQRHIAPLIRAQNGNHLMAVKQNQPTLHWAIQLVFEEPPLPRQPGERLSARIVDKAHGRWERHTLVTITALNRYLDWPGAAQVLRRVCRTRADLARSLDH